MKVLAQKQYNDNNEVCIIETASVTQNCFRFSGIIPLTASTAAAAAVEAAGAAVAAAASSGGSQSMPVTPQSTEMPLLPVVPPGTFSLSIKVEKT